LWSRKNYLTNRLVHDPLRWFQVWLAVRLSKLVLLKGPQLVRDFGGGRPHVKNFLDTAHTAEQVLSEDELNQRLSWLSDRTQPLQLTYFGRLVSYKGINLAIEAIRLARAKGKDIRLTIIGDGPELSSLRRQADDAGLSEAVSFTPAVKYGEPLFRLLSNFHASVACPLVEDTPRSAFDSMARGLPIVAFDLDYFKDLAEMSGAVTTAGWPSPEKLADAFVALDADRTALMEQTRKAVAFAKANTQQIWMERRQAWLTEYVLNDPRAAKGEQQQQH
jgi:glycosyltransferase involved in cell wall biosynthesis